MSQTIKFESMRNKNLVVSFLSAAVVAFVLSLIMRLNYTGDYFSAGKILLIVFSGIFIGIMGICFTLLFIVGLSSVYRLISARKNDILMSLPIKPAARVSGLLTFYMLAIFVSTCIIVAVSLFFALSIEPFVVDWPEFAFDDYGRMLYAIVLIITWTAMPLTTSWALSVLQRRFCEGSKLGGLGQLIVGEIVLLMMISSIVGLMEYNNFFEYYSGFYLLPTLLISLGVTVLSVFITNTYIDPAQKPGGNFGRKLGVIIGAGVLIIAAIIIGIGFLSSNAMKVTEGEVTTAVTQMQSPAKSVSIKMKSYSTITRLTTPKVILTPDSNEVSITSNEGVIKYFDIEVIGSDVIITQNKPIRGNTECTIEIGVANLEYIENDALIEIRSKQALKGNSLNMVSRGVGNVYMSLDYDAVKVKSDGVGSLRYDGRADSLEIDSNGVGNIAASDLVSRNAVVMSDGVGNIEVNATDTLSIDLRGIGNIKYWGDPKTTINRDGIGRVQSMSGK